MFLRVLVFIFIIFEYSCTVIKASYVSKESITIGKVNVVEINKPMLHKKHTILTKAVNYIPLTGGFAWGAIYGKKIEYKDVNKNSKEIGLAGGLIIGGLTSLLGVVITESLKPKEKSIPINDVTIKKWMKKQKSFRTAYIPVSESNFDKLLLFPKDSYNNYIATNSDEINWYKLAFGNLDEDGFIERSLLQNNSDGFFINLYNYAQIDINKKKIAIEYINSSKDFSTYIERTKRYIVIDHNERANQASNFVNNLSSAISFYKEFPEEKNLQGKIFDKLYSKLSQTELILLLKTYKDSKKFSLGFRQCLKLSTTFTEFSNVAQNFSDQNITLPIKNPTTLDDAAKQTKYIEEVCGKYLPFEKVDNFILAFQEPFFFEYLKKLNTEDELLNFKEKLNEFSWVHPNVKDKVFQKLQEEFEYYKKLKIFSELKQEFGDAALFAQAEIYPNDRVTSSLLTQIESLTHKYIRIEKSDLATAMGNHNSLDHFTRYLFSSAKFGGQHNLFVWGILSNSLDFPIKIDLTSTLNYSNTSGVSIFQSTVNKKWDESYLVEVPANGTTPFLVIYKDFRVGGTIGSGLFTAGSVSNINENNPFDIRFKYHLGTIPEDIKLKQKDLIDQIVKNGNVKINDSEAAKKNREEEILNFHREIEKKNQDEKFASEKRQEEKRKESEEKSILKCIKDVENNLSLLETKPYNLFTDSDCPCLYYSDPSFWGYTLNIKMNKEQEWQYILPDWIFSKESELFSSKKEAIRGVCEKWNKNN